MSAQKISSKFLWRNFHNDRSKIGNFAQNCQNAPYALRGLHLTTNISVTAPMSFFNQSINQSIMYFLTKKYRITKTTFVYYSYS